MADKNAADYTKQLEQELAAAKQAASDALTQKEAAEKAAKQAEEALKKSGGPVPIRGKYKGYRFPDGHTRIRDAEGNLLDTQAVLDAANAGAETAKAVLDRLIALKYAYLTK